MAHDYHARVCLYQRCARRLQGGSTGECPRAPVWRSTLAIADILRLHHDSHLVPSCFSRLYRASFALHESHRTLLVSGERRPHNTHRPCASRRTRRSFAASRFCARCVAHMDVPRVAGALHSKQSPFLRRAARRSRCRSRAEVRIRSRDIPSRFFFLHGGQVLYPFGASTFPHTVQRARRVSNACRTWYFWRFRSRWSAQTNKPSTAACLHLRHWPFALRAARYSRPFAA